MTEHLVFKQKLLEGVEKMNWNKKMTRRELLKYIGKYSAAGSLLLLASACAPKVQTDNSNNGGNTGPDFTGELSLLLGSHMNYLQDLAPVYKEQFGVEPSIELVTSPDLSNKLTTSFLARTAPWDVVFNTATVAADMADNDWIMDLTDRMGDLGDHEILEGSLEAVRFNGQQFAIPVTSGCPILVWNKEMLENFDLDPNAPENWHSTPNSWDEFVEFAKSMTKSIDGTEYYGLTDAWADDQVLLTYRALIQMHGGDVLDENFQPVMNSDAGIESLQKMVDLLHTHKCIDPAVRTYTWVFDAAPSFLNGTRGMIFTWPFMADVADDPEESDIAGNVGFAPNPAVDTSASADGSEFLAIPALSENVEEAWRFIQLATSYEKQKEQGMNTEWLPIYAELLEDPDVVAANKVAPVIKQAYEYPTRGYYSPNYGRWTEVLANEIHEALGQKKSPKDALNDAAKEIEKIMNE